jgi:hypothetical protein
MTLIPEVRAEIHDVARRRASLTAAGRSTRNRWRPTVGSLAVTASVVVVVGVVAVILLHAYRNNIGTSGSQHGGTPPQGWVRLDGQAMDQTRKRDPACRLRRRTGPSPVRDGAPDPALSSQLAVLRRPAPPRQRVSPEQLHHIGGVSQFARGVDIRYVRQGRLDGVSYYLIPAANITQVYPIPRRCYREQLHAFRALARTQPSARQAALIAFEAKVLKSLQARLQPTAGVCLAYRALNVSGGGPCSTAASLRELLGASGGPSGSAGNDHGTVTAMIVPDKVATVTARYDAQTRPGVVPHPITTTHRVTNNIVIFDLHGAWDPPASITYRSANGSVLSSSKRP